VSTKILNARFVSARTVCLGLPDRRTKRVAQAAVVKDVAKRNRSRHQERRTRKWVQGAVPRRAVWAAALAVKRMSAHRGGKGEALHGVQTVRAAGRVSNVALDGEMVTIESRIAVAAVLHQVHAGVAHVADSGIVATAGHRTARTAASGVTASQEGARTVGNEATCDDPAAPRATAGGARPAVVGATAGAHDVMTKGAERSASRPAVWAPDVIEAALLEAGATVATTEGHQGAPAAPVTDTPVDARARAVVKTTCAFTTSWTSAAKVTTATTATLTSLR